MMDEPKFIPEQNMYDPCFPDAYGCVGIINTKQAQINTYLQVVIMF